MYGGDVTIDEYRQETILQHTEIENTSCADPMWMGSNSFYPRGTIIIITSTYVHLILTGTICGVAPSRQGCFDTGDSGSGLFMERFQGGNSWEGMLSAYRG